MPESIEIARVLACGFFAVLFLQSGIDKVIDWKGNMAWLQPHFANSPLKGQVPLLLGVITLMEVLTGVVSAVAAVMLLFMDPGYLPRIALGLATLTLLMLFAGQRLAKDYAGAATLAAYFAVALIGLTLLP